MLAAPRQSSVAAAAEDDCRLLSVFQQGGSSGSGSNSGTAVEQSAAVEQHAVESASVVQSASESARVLWPASVEQPVQTSSAVPVEQHVHISSAVPVVQPSSEISRAIPASNIVASPVVPFKLQGLSIADLSQSASSLRACLWTP